MAQFQVLDGSGAQLDAHFSIEGDSLVYHSRGGTKGSSTQRNADYTQGLRLLLQRLERAGLSPKGAWVDSSAVQHLPLDQRSLLTGSEGSGTPEDVLGLISSRMRSVGRAASAQASGGNTTRRIRLQLPRPVEANEATELLNAKIADKDLRYEKRLPSEMLQAVRPDHIWRAVQRLLGNQVEHPFGPSTDYDVIVSGEQRLPPKAVFGLAATDALGFEVLPIHFSAGLGTPCFRALDEAGLLVVPKGAAAEPVTAMLPFAEGEWQEGGKKFVEHLRSERDRGLPEAKRAAFRAQHGELFCERCNLRPRQVYGLDHGDACIEVHHARTQVADMASGHVSRLEDLMCLCANCHRVVHSELRSRNKR